MLRCCAASVSCSLGSWLLFDWHGLPLPTLSNKLAPFLFRRTTTAESGEAQHQKQHFNRPAQNIPAFWTATSHYEGTQWHIVLTARLSTVTRSGQRGDSLLAFLSSKSKVNTRLLTSIVQSASLHAGVLTGCICKHWRMGFHKVGLWTLQLLMRSSRLLWIIHFGASLKFLSFNEHMGAERCACQVTATGNWEDGD